MKFQLPYNNTVTWCYYTPSYKSVVIQTYNPTSNIDRREYNRIEYHLFHKQQEVLRIQIQAHILPVLRKLMALLEYQGVVQNIALISFLRLLQETLTYNVS